MDLIIWIPEVYSHVEVAVSSNPEMGNKLIEITHNYLFIGEIDNVHIYPI